MSTVITNDDINSSIREVKYDFKLLVSTFTIYKLFLKEVQNNLEKKYGRTIRILEMNKIVKFIKNFLDRKSFNKKLKTNLKEINSSIKINTVVSKKDNRNLIQLTTEKMKSEFKSVPMSNIKRLKVVKKVFSVISVFNGIGAATDALKQMGINIKIDTICEIDKDANNTYYNNNERTNHVDDINELLVKIEKGKVVDILVQTPPCQSFSMGGLRKGLDSDNGNLFLTSIKLQKKINANIVVYENVKGITSHDKGEYTYQKEDGSTFTTRSQKTEKVLVKEKLTLIKTVDLSHTSLINKDYNNTIGHTLHKIEELLLEDKRYNYYWKIINSCDQGLPQNRERIFIIGIKKELDNGFTFPENRDLDFTVNDVLEDNVPENYYYQNINNHPLNPTNQKQRKNRIHTTHKFDETMTYESTRRVYSPYVSPCITCNNSNKFMIDGRVRLLTPTENKRIHGFREEFEFVGTQTQINKQLGNTVSPGVYKNLFTSILESIEVIVETEPTVSKTKKVRQPKKTVVVNDHISVSKKIMNTPDENYLNLTQHKFDEYESHLKNGGTISMSIEKYKTNSDKKSNKLECRYVVTINNLTQLGFRDKKNGIYRIRITGTKEKLDKVGKRDVLITRQGGKGKFIDKFYHSLEDMNILDKKLPVVVDSFFGGGGLTLNLVEKLSFWKYIINDLEPLIYKTMLAIKKDYKKVLDVYQKINNEYFDSISDELRNYKKDPSVRIDPKLQKIRNEDRKYRDIYREIGNRLNDTELDIYTISGYFIFFNNKSTNGTLTFQKDGSIDITNCNNETTLKDKTHMVKYWSYLLNKHNIEIMNKDVFEVLEDIPSDGLVFSDGPYCSVSMNYGMDNSSKFQIDLHTKLNRFNNIIYCNEDCDSLYELNLDKGFDNTQKFPRNNKLGCSTKTDGGFEFLGYRSSFMKKQTHSKSENNTTYKPNKKIA